MPEVASLCSGGNIVLEITSLTSKQSSGMGMTLVEAAQSASDLALVLATPKNHLGNAYTGTASRQASGEHSTA